jgi:hypothetical protein
MGFKLKVQCLEEWREQELLCEWMTLMRIVFYHVPNGGTRPVGEALKFKRIGVKAGVPDLCIPVPRSPYHGAYIELKRVSGGVVSEKQKKWLKFLDGQGYYAIACAGFEEAKKRIEWYFSKRDNLG